ncbi:MAG: fumarylacetoacetate hydrolase family protein [Tissierellia bacterium]|nr:fumarylacetoacetate hydrolase family protein [Tissierellia bacterium]
MIISRFFDGKQSRLGKIEEEKILPLGAIDLLDYLEADPPLPQGQALDLREVELLPPFEEGARVFCLGKNYLDHVKELAGLSTVKDTIPQAPIYFMKACKELSGDHCLISQWQQHTHCLDYEVELVLVIGKKCKNVRKEEVKEVIFGYLIGNDFTARDLQTKHNQWLKGKSLDGFTALSSRVITTDELDFPPELELKLYVNDRLRQRGTTKDLLFDIPTLVSELSQGLTLYPGDLIFTGTPSGVGAGMNPPGYLKSGDIVRCEIETLGSLTNHIE